MKVLYVDMDNVLVDFQSGIDKLSTDIVEKYEDNEDNVDGIFSLMDPKPNAIEAVEFLAKHFDLYILSTAPWENPSAWKDKLLWIKKYLPKVAYKRLIISHHKNLNAGDYLIDDRPNNGADKFGGELIPFLKKGTKDWVDVVRYLCAKENIAMPNWAN